MAQRDLLCDAMEFCCFARIGIKAFLVDAALIAVGIFQKLPSLPDGNRLTCSDEHVRRWRAGSTLVWCVCVQLAQLACSVVLWVLMGSMSAGQGGGLERVSCLGLGLLKRRMWARTVDAVLSAVVLPSRITWANSQGATSNCSCHAACFLLMLPQLSSSRARLGYGGSCQPFPLVYQSVGPGSGQC